MFQLSGVHCKMLAIGPSGGRRLWGLKGVGVRVCGFKHNLEFGGTEAEGYKL